jgi:hypothetical protein
MAGLLDFGSNPYAGLLSEEDLAGARRQATTDALLKLSSGLFQAGAPSRTPQSLGAALAGGLQGVGAGYQGTLQQAAQQKLMQQKLQADLQSRQRTADAQKLVGGLYRPAQAATQGIMDSPDVVVPPRPATPGGINQDVMSQLMALGPEGQKAIMDRLGMQKMMQPEMFSVAEGGVQYSRDPFSGAVTEVASGAPKMSDLERQFNFAKSPQGGGYTGTFEQFKAISAPKTTNIVNPLQPDKGVVGDLQTMLVTAGDRKMRFNQIESSYRPEFSTVPYRGLQAWNSLKDRAGLLNDDEKANLAAYTQWRQNTMTNLARTINEISGTAAGEGEVARLRKTMPDSGTGVFDGDSPTEFEAKTQETLKQLRMIEARTTYLLKNGLTLDKVPLDSMPQIINQRGKEIAAQYKLDLSKPRDLDLIKKQLSAEFGISTQ